MADTRIIAPDTARAPRLDGQLSKIAVDTRGTVKIEISVPLHVAVPLAAPLLEAYGSTVLVVLEP